MGPGGDEGARFDRFHAEYDVALSRGLSVSGEGKAYFARGRVEFLARCLREDGVRPSAVLDFGCGTGSAAPLFLDLLGAERVLGVDVSERSLEVARREHGSERVRFVTLQDFRPDGSFPLAFCNGVFHHVRPEERGGVVDLLRRSLAPGGRFALWDNNPWNPGARYVMWRIPFDRDAVMLSSREAARILARGGLEVLRTDYLFVFPRFLKALRGLEAALARAPLGAQYQVLARRPER
jgi:SAM-dependent methyltransferase